MTPPRAPRTTLRRAVLLLAASFSVLLLCVAPTGAAFDAVTADAGNSAGATALTGSHAPAAGVASFTAASLNIQQCQLSWSALVGGTAVADRFQVTVPATGAVVTTTASVGAGSFAASQTPTVQTYRLATRRATNWVSSAVDARTATCSQAALASVSSGRNGACGIRVAGTLFCWGMGDDLVTGDTNRYLRTNDAVVGAANTWRQVAVGHFGTCATRTDDTGWCWGTNWAGGVGDGTTTERPSPVQVAGNWTQMAAGDSHACGVKTDGGLWCWGRNAYGQLGLGTTIDQSSPGRVGTDTWLFVSTQSDHTCAIRSDTTLWCWGANWSGQIGNGTFTDVPSPIQISGTWSDVAAGASTTCAVRTSGALYCWGANSWMQAGSSPAVDLTSPTQVGSISTWARVAVGAHASCALRLDRSLWCWGTDAFGATGQGTFSWTPNAVPAQVGTATNWSIITGDDTHFCGLNLTGTLYCWGNGGAGGTGQGGASFATFAQLGAVTTWNGLAAGGEFNCATRADATLWCWGDGYTLQLDDSSQDFRAAPVQITTGGSTSFLPAFSAGYQHACAIRSDSQLYCWGANGSGQLGQGTASWRSGDVRVGVSTYLQVSAGFVHTCAIRSDSTLWCWGDNSFGQLGDGTTADRTAPVQVSGGGTWTSVSAGAWHTCAVKSTGSVWCWGANWMGQLGNGTSTDSSAPVQSGGSLLYGSVDAGKFHTCATRTDGTLWCWGDNSSGGVGDGTTNQRLSPVQVGAAVTWNSVSAGNRTTCGHRTDDTVWCWGIGNSGQIGNGTVSGTNASPIQVATSAASIRTSDYGWHTCLVTTSGTIKCAGANTRAQLGTANYVATPSIVPGTWK